MLGDDEPTGLHVPSDGWSSCGSMVEEWDDVRSVSSRTASVDWDFDVRSLASCATSQLDARSLASSSGRSVTATAGDHLHAEWDTAQTTVPLAAIPAHRFLSLPHGGETQSEDATSMVSLSTRRGWPRVSPTTRAQPQPTVAPEHGSYRDALLRGPQTAEEAEERQQAARAEAINSSRQRTDDASRRGGWVVLSRRPRGALRMRQALQLGGERLEPLAEE